MVSKKTGGIVLIVIGVLLLVGAIFMHTRVTGNQETYDDNERLLGDIYTEGKDGMPRTPLTIKRSFA